jgi:asparaginyl-tRNA synthetase
MTQAAQTATEWSRIEDVVSGRREGQTVHLRGWVHRWREQGKLVFLTLRDGTGVIQCTIKRGNLPDEQFEDAKRASLLESSVEVHGPAKADARAPGGWEVQATGFRAIHVGDVFPITEDQSVEFLLDVRHLWLRSQHLTKVMKVKHVMLGAMRDYLNAHGWWETTPSVITPAAGEGGSTLFPFKYFDQTAYLSQTAQMYLEVLMFSLEKVYSITPSFRAEKSRTTRHLAEFTHLEVETAWFGQEENLHLQEELVAHAVHACIEKVPHLLKDLGRNPEELRAVKAPFPRMDYGEAVEKLQDLGEKIQWGDDFGAPQERALMQGRNVPLFVTNFPREVKAFYMKVNPDHPDTVLCADLLAPEGYGEIIGGSVREEDNALLIERLQKENADLKAYEWYLDLRRYGSIPHAGFGLGVERVLQWIVKGEHIRDMTPFPRTMSRAYP